MNEKVSEVMSPGVATLKPRDSLKHAAAMMEACDVGPMPVCDGDRMVGILTDRDITVRAVAHGLDPRVTTVAEAMTPQAEYCFEDETIEEAIERMRKHEVRRLPVLDREMRLVGMLSLADLAMHTDTRTKAEALECVSGAMAAGGGSRHREADGRGAAEEEER